MTKQPEALRVAEVLAGSPNYSGTPIWEAIEMLRRQHEAIVKLREACQQVFDQWGECQATKKCRQALKDTEEFQ